MAEPGTGNVRTKLVFCCSSKDLDLKISWKINAKRIKYFHCSLIGTGSGKFQYISFHFSHKLVLFHTFQRPRKKKQ
jgi:hypothetical protein